MEVVSNDHSQINNFTAQKMKFSIKDFFIFCAVFGEPDYLLF